jgi:hypothetical protein
MQTSSATNNASEEISLPTMWKLIQHANMNYNWNLSTIEKAITYQFYVWNKYCSLMMTFYKSKHVALN